MFDGRWRHAVDRGTQPVGRFLVRAHITADVITIFGLAMSLLAAFVVGSGHLLIGIPMLFATGLPDLFDGPVAKASGTTSVRGAYLDSVADRISDAFLLGGVAYFLASHHKGEAVLVPFAILGVTSLISYQRAKAELLGISAKGGLMERAERFILLGLCFIAGSVSASAFVPSLWVFLGLVSATALGRFVKVIAVAEGPVLAPEQRSRSLRRTASLSQAVDPVDSESAHSGHLAEVSRRAMARLREERADSRWRAWRDSRAQREPAVPKFGWQRRAATDRDAADSESGDPESRWWARSQGARRAIGPGSGRPRSYKARSNRSRTSKTRSYGAGSARSRSNGTRAYKSQAPDRGSESSKD